MPELFNIFGDNQTRQPTKNVARRPLDNIENMGNMGSTGPIKPNEPVKGVEPKKSFLSNTGKALQSTPLRQTFTPRAVNVGPMIYSDANGVSDNDINEMLEFTRPSYDNYKNLMENLLLPEPNTKRRPPSPARTPPPNIKSYSVELENSYSDDFFIDDFSSESFADPNDSDLGLPDIY